MNKILTDDDIKIFNDYVNKLILQQPLKHPNQKEDYPKGKQYYNDRLNLCIDPTSHFDMKTKSKIIDKMVCDLLTDLGYEDIVYKYREFVNMRNNLWMNY